MTVRKTHRQLGITERAYDALIWVRDALDKTVTDHALPSWIKFDMTTWSDMRTGERRDQGDGRRGCGTACCIGGSMAMHMAGFTTDGGKRSAVWTAEDTARYWGTLNTFRHNSRFEALLTDYPMARRKPKDAVAAVAAIDRFLAGETRDPWQVRTVAAS